MTDEELVKRLRDKHCCESPNCNCDEAADRIEALTAERDDYAFKLADANNTYSEMHVALSEANDKLATCEKYRDAYDKMGRIGTEAYRDLEAKLAKAVEGLNYCINAPFSGWTIAQGYARATLAEIEGEKT